MVRAPFDSGRRLLVTRLFLAGVDGAGLNPDTGNSCGKVPAGNTANAFPIVVYGGNGACHMGSMSKIPVAIFRADGEVVVIPGEVVPGMAAPIGPQVGLEVLVGGIYGLIYHAHDHGRFALGVGVPHLLHVDIGPTCAHIMPLFGKIGVIESAQGNPMAAPGIQHAGDGREAFRRLGLRDIGPELHVIETVQAFPAGALLKRAGMREYTLQLLYAKVLEHRIQRGRFGLHAPLRQGFFHQGGELIVELHGGDVFLHHLFHRLGSGSHIFFVCRRAGC